MSHVTRVVSIKRRGVYQLFLGSSSFHMKKKGSTGYRGHYNLIILRTRKRTLSWVNRGLWRRGLMEHLVPFMPNQTLYGTLKDYTHSHMMVYKCVKNVIFLIRAVKISHRNNPCIQLLWKFNTFSNESFVLSAFKRLILFIRV